MRDWVKQQEEAWKDKGITVRPCPFCNGTELDFKYSKYSDVGHVKCVNEICLIQPQTKDYKSALTAIEAWNTRRRE